MILIKRKIRSPRALNGEIVSANVYMGMEGIIKALQKCAAIIITGRVSDPALFLAPLVLNSYGLLMTMTIW